MRTRSKTGTQAADLYLLSVLQGKPANPEGWLLVHYAQLADDAKCTVATLMSRLDSLYRNKLVTRRVVRYEGRQRIEIKLLNVEATAS